MAADPYGFPEAAPASGTPGDATASLWTGVSSLILGAIGPCLCYLPWFLALPLSVAAVYYGARAMKSTDVSSSDGLRAAANAGFVSGLVALLLSLLYVVLFVVYLVYMIVVFGAIAASEF